MIYSERLHPSGPAAAALATLGACLALIALPFSQLATLILIVVFALLAPALAWALSPKLTVTSGPDPELTYGHAHIPIRFLTDPRPVTAEELHDYIGLKSSPSTWVGYSMYVKSAVALTNIDPADRVDTWVVCTRTPERLVSAVQEAHSEHTS